MAGKPNTNKPRFNTHIPEPRWQRVVSLIIVALIVAYIIWRIVHAVH